MKNIWELPVYCILDLIGPKNEYSWNLSDPDDETMCTLACVKIDISYHMAYKK